MPLRATDVDLMELSFVVLGHAQPAGSKRAFAIKRGGVATGQVAVTDANERSKPWQAEVKAAAAEAMWDEDYTLYDQWTGPLLLSLTFHVLRPKGHYGTGRNAGTVKASAPLWPKSKPDVSKLVRGVEDAMTGIVYVDDAQIVQQYAEKRYGFPERVEVVVRSL